MMAGNKDPEALLFDHHDHEALVVVRTNYGLQSDLEAFANDAETSREHSGMPAPWEKPNVREAKERANMEVESGYESMSGRRGREQQQELQRQWQWQQQQERQWQQERQQRQEEEEVGE